LLFCTDVQSAEELGSRLSERFGVDAVSATTSVSALWKAQLREAFVLPGAQSAIEDLKAASVPRAYLSNIWPPFYAHFEQEFSAEAHHQPQFLSFQMGMLKPNPQFFLAALKAVSISPQDAVMVGDTYVHDIEPAMKLGMRTVWILHRAHKEKAALIRVMNQEAPPPDLTLASIGDVRADQLLSLIHNGGKAPWRS